MTKEQVVSAANAANVRLIRFLYYDNGGVIRGKLAHIDSLTRRLDTGIGLNVAHQHGLLASLAPKPLPEQAGDEFHIHWSVWDWEGQKNLLYDPADRYKMSELGCHFIAGVLAQLLDCRPTLEVVLEARAAEDYAAWVQRLFEDAKIELLLCDYGYQGEVMDMAPTSKLMFATDAFTMPEIFWLAARWRRWGLGWALETFVVDGFMNAGEAWMTARSILGDNARQLYRLQELGRLYRRGHFLAAKAIHRMVMDHRHCPHEGVDDRRANGAVSD